MVKARGMVITTGRAETANGSKYLRRLCKHWSHKFDVDASDTEGRIRFPSAVATLEASATALLITVESEDTGAVERLKDTMTEHLNRFAFREAPLTFAWSALDDR